MALNACGLQITVSPLLNIIAEVWLGKKHGSDRYLT